MEVETSKMSRLVSLFYWFYCSMTNISGTGSYSHYAETVIEVCKPDGAQHADISLHCMSTHDNKAQLELEGRTTA